MTSPADFLYVWGMAAVVVLLPTGLVAMWAFCRGGPEARAASSPDTHVQAGVPAGLSGSTAAKAA